MNPLGLSQKRMPEEEMGQSRGRGVKECKQENRLQADDNSTNGGGRTKGDADSRIKPDASRNSGSAREGRFRLKEKRRMLTLRSFGNDYLRRKRYPRGV